jgi:hypothetical protein
MAYRLLLDMYLVLSRPSYHIRHCSEPRYTRDHAHFETILLVESASTWSSGEAYCVVTHLCLAYPEQTLGKDRRAVGTHLAGLDRNRRRSLVLIEG